MSHTYLVTPACDDRSPLVQSAAPQPNAVPPDARNPAALMDQHERMRMRTAAFRAQRRYPGPVGECVSREILDFEEFGYRLVNGGRIVALVDEIMRPELTEKVP